MPDQWDLTFAGVYRVSPDLGTLTLLVADFVMPNGIAFSPDESVLYVNDSRRRHIRAFDLAPNGTLARQTDRVFADLRGGESGVPDGMKVDSAGNVYCGGSGGHLRSGPEGQETRPHRARAAGDHQSGVRRTDWKTLLLHHRGTFWARSTSRSPAFRFRWRKRGSACIGRRSAP